MISLPSGTRICMVANVTDMRKSFNGLVELVQSDPNGQGEKGLHPMRLHR